MMNYRILATMQASKFEKPFEEVIAEFATFINAEDFVDMLEFQNKESIGKFRIEHIEN